MASDAKVSEVKRVPLYVELDESVIKAFNDARGDLTQAVFLTQVLEYALPRVVGIETARVKFSVTPKEEKKNKVQTST